MDLLGDVLRVSGVRGTVGARIEAGDDWGWWWASPRPRAALHAVTSGTVWIGLPGQEQLQLMPGDVVLLPDGVEHALGSDSAAVARTSVRHFDPWHKIETGAIRIGAGPVRSHVLCADYGHDAGISTQVLSLLPPLVHIRARSDGGPLEDTVRLLGRELASPGMAGGVVLDRLVDILLVQVLRTWLSSEHGHVPSWLGALRDDMVGMAVAKLHEDPARPWTTNVLAREVGVSRATLTRRFTAATGVSPGAYLGRWRMDLAAHSLRDTSDSLETIARSVGYTSAYAFNRAFSRSRSESPGRYRHRMVHAQVMTADD